MVFFSRDTRDVRETPPKSYQSLILNGCGVFAAEYNITYAHKVGTVCRVQAQLIASVLLG